MVVRHQRSGRAARKIDRILKDVKAQDEKRRRDTQNDGVPSDYGWLRSDLPPENPDRDN